MGILANVCFAAMVFMVITQLVIIFVVKKLIKVVEEQTQKIGSELIYVREQMTTIYLHCKYDVDKDKPTNESVMELKQM